MRIFFPIEDANIDHEAGVLVPYRHGLTCAHALRDPLELRDGVWMERSGLSDGSAARLPIADPAHAPARH
jgi:hypothetical protein